MDRGELWKINEQLKHVEESLAEIRGYIDRYFTREEQDILCMKASIGREETVLERLGGEEKKAYARDCLEYLKVGKEIDACLAGELDRGTAVCLGPAPPVLETVGCGRTEMYITQKHLKRILHESDESALHYHGIKLQQLKQIPELLKHPAAIVASGKDPDTILVALHAMDQQQRPLIVPVKRNGSAYYGGKQVDANFFLSIYGKGNMDHFLKKNAALGSVLYWDKKNKYQLRKGAAPIAAAPKA